MRPVAILSIWIGISAAFWIANYFLPYEILINLFYTFTALSIIYLIFRVILYERLSSAISDKKTKYSFTRIISILYVGIFLIVLVFIWIEDPQEVIIASGLAGAGIAVALQDFFKNLLGGTLIFLTSIYRVGDRIEIASKSGDVMDVGILYTTLLETREWVGGDQATGRLTTVPNGLVLNNPVNNYTKDHYFLWDEISMPISYSSNWMKAIEKILIIVRSETQETTVQAQAEIEQLEEKYYLDKRTTEPNIYITPTDNWITFNIRYVTAVRERRVVKDRISRLVLEEIEKSDDIELGSETLDITSFPQSSENEMKRRGQERKSKRVGYSDTREL